MNQKNPTSIQILDVHEITPLTDVFIIAIASNIRQTQAIADQVEDVLLKNGILPHQKEGYQTAKWILIDYGDVIVHVLYKEDAAFYALDRLWKDAKIIDFA